PCEALEFGSAQAGWNVEPVVGQERAVGEKTEERAQEPVLVEVAVHAAEPSIAFNFKEGVILPAVLDVIRQRWSGSADVILHDEVHRRSVFLRDVGSLDLLESGEDI